MNIQLLLNLLLIFLAVVAAFAVLLFFYRWREKRVRKGRLLGLSVCILLLYVLIGIFAAYLRHPAVSDEYQGKWNGGDFYGDAPGNERVALIRTNQAALEERLRLIYRAQERIILSTFDFCADHSGLDVVSALYEAAERGVHVEIVADGFNAMLNMDGERHFQTLAAHPNVEIFIYNPPNVLKPWALMGRLHDKYILVDDQYVMLGGRNTNDFFLGEYPSNSYSRDMEVLVCGGGAALKQVEDYYFRIRELPDTRAYRGARERKEIREELAARAQELRAVYPQCYQECDDIARTFPAARITLLSNPIHTGAKEPQLFWSLIKLMEGAREQILLHTPYVICNDAMYQGLQDAAECVPDARLVLNSAETAANMFGACVYQNEKDRILETGFDLYTYYSQEPGVSSHMKAALLDHRLAVIGSFNMDMRSAYLDTETVLVIDSPELAAELAEHMAGIEASSGHITTDGIQLPDGVEVPQLPLMKRGLMLLMRIAEHPIRFLM